MSISFLLYNQDSANFRLTPLPDDAQLSLSNDNAFAVLEALGIEEPCSSSPWPIACFRSLLTVARRKRLGHSSPASPSAEHHEPGRMTLIDCGRAEGYIERRLKDLSDLVNTGLEAGATHVAWG
ncbi:hypothetical protein [uncultured Rhodoblastus sp.]|uniref:hypothetical protein n=1 Tax=uncultured Rhodoblastus sp. TaxID=543037 RepID=UPI0025E5FB30|nr:hypothetical protein [uncultured Rhodoblastus sp.]